MNILGAREFYLFVRRDVQTLGPAATIAPAPQSRGASGPADQHRRRATPWPSSSTRTTGCSGWTRPASRSCSSRRASRSGRTAGSTSARAAATASPSSTRTARSRRPGAGPAAADGEFNEPWGIAVAPNGEVYVADTWNHRIQKFSARRAVHHGLGRPGRRQQPRSAVGARPVLGAALDRHWPGRAGLRDRHRQQAHPGVRRQRHSSCGRSGRPGPSLASSTSRSAWRSTATTLLVADAWNGRIQRLDRNGAPIGSVPIQGWENRGVAEQAVHRGWSGRRALHHACPSAAKSIRSRRPARSRRSGGRPIARTGSATRPASRSGRTVRSTPPRAPGGTVLVERVGGSP